MSRIRKGYEERFRALLKEAGARRVEQGVKWLVGKARQVSVARKIPLTEALTRVYEDVAERPYFRRNSKAAPKLFFCDAGLGGLARWLRAAGHDALWKEGIDDNELLRDAREKGPTILTTDSGIMERRLVRDGIIPALWLPPTMKIPEQLELVFREFGLKMGESRCMSCGGELVRGEKEALKERIPQRTYRWLDEYFVCARCGKLFWKGTHWRKIERELGKIV